MPRTTVNIRLDKNRLAGYAGFKAKGQVRMTIKGDHVSDGVYSKWTKDAYELAEMHNKGGRNPKRPFMYNAKKMIAEDAGIRDRVTKAIKRYSRISKRTGEVLIRWNAVGTWLKSLIRSLLKGGKLGLYPLQPSTIAMKKKYGYRSNPLYASGGLADCIAYEVV